MQKTTVFVIENRVYEVSPGWDANLDAVKVEGDKVVGLKCGVFTPDLTDGDVYYKVAAASLIDEVAAQGRHVISVDVVDEHYNRVQGARVWHGWPTERWPQFDERVQMTVFGSQLAEWGLYASFDAWKVPGPYWVQVADAKSDVFWGAGLPWKHHVSFAVVFQRTVYSAQPAYATLLDALRGEAQARQVIQFNPTAALQARIFADGFVPNSPEFALVFEGATYQVQRAEHLRTGRVRAYYAAAGDWGNVHYLEW